MRKPVSLKSRVNFIVRYKIFVISIFVSLICNNAHGIQCADLFQPHSISQNFADHPNSREYVRNLDIMLPIYRQYIDHLLAKYPNHKWVFLGRDAHYLFVAARSYLKDSPKLSDIIELDLSSPLRSRIEKEYDMKGNPKDFPSYEYLSSKIDFEALHAGTSKYLLIDTGFMGTNVNWLRAYYRDIYELEFTIGSVIGKHEGLGLYNNWNGQPFEAIFMNSQYSSFGRMFPDYYRPPYPEFPLKRVSERDLIDSLVLPLDAQSGIPGASYAIAAASQFLPKAVGHLSHLIRDTNGVLTSRSKEVAISSINELVPMSQTRVRSERPNLTDSAEIIRQMGKTLDWNAPIFPELAFFLEGRVQNYFSNLQH